MRWTGRGLRRTSLAITIAALLSTGTAFAGEPRPAAGEDRALARLISARIRILSDGVSAAEHCLDLGVRDLEVRLRGRRIEDSSSIELERDKPPTVHALLIDTSRSMIGSLDAVRAAATRYVERLDPTRESALVVTFDEDVILEQAVAADHERLVAAIGAVEMGSHTALLDALAYVLRELGTRPERRIVLLLTDGVDTASLNERRDVTELSAKTRASVFTVGYQLPELGLTSSPQFTVTRSFLQRLAEATDGEFFDTPRVGELDRVYQRVRELVEGEATLNLVDPEPHAPSTRLHVSSKRPGCRVELLGPAPPAVPPSEGVEPPWNELPRRFPLAFSDAWRVHLNRAHHEVLAACGGGDVRLAAEREWLAREAWFIKYGGRFLEGCALDVHRDLGRLYDPVYQGWSSYNTWLELETRPFRVDLPRFADLPTAPEDVLDALSRQALGPTGVAETPKAKRREDEHALPHGDYPMLLSGRTFLEMRRELARATFQARDYREWMLSRVEAEAGRDIERLRERYRLRLPHVAPEIIDSAIIASDEGRTILRDARRPSVASLERHLAAWLGDLSAHELFVAWEARHVERLVSGRGAADFSERWIALRRLFRAPSYVRVMTLLSPVRDPARDAVGYWRVVLPRVSWFLPRMPGFERHPEWSDLPLDLVPDLPFGYHAVEQGMRQDPELAALLSAGRWRVEPTRYVLTGRQRHHTPVRAYESARVTLVLRRDTSGETLEITAAVGMDEERALVEPVLTWREFTAGSNQVDSD